MSRDESVQQLSNGRWVVAEWDEGAGMYYAPMTALERRVTGCHTYCARSVDNLCGGYTYARRSDALRRARKVWEEDA
jgi:hypothetical protein